MARLNPLAVTALLAFFQATSAAPAVTLPDVTANIAGLVGNILHPLGIDPSLIRIPRPGETLAELKTLTREALDAITATDSPPFVPSGSNAKRSDEGGHLEERFIVGTDDRRLYNDTAFPYSAVGKLTWSNGVFCSAALVGPRHVLTARHCIPNAAGVAGRFAPSFDNGERFQGGNVATSSTVPPTTGSCDTKNDWAVLVIDQRLGDNLGWFGVKYPDRAQFDKPNFTHLGYPGDKDNGNRPYRQLGNSVASRNSLDCDATGPFYTDTDVIGGQSGGPHWETASNGPYIWGALSITVSSSQNTFAGWASGTDMVRAIVASRRDFP